MKEWSASGKWLFGSVAAMIIAAVLYGAGNIEFTASEDSKNSSKSLSYTNKQFSGPGAIEATTATERIIFDDEPPYLSELPILDNNIYVKYDGNAFLLGGTNLSLIRYSAWTDSGNRATIQDREGYIEFVMVEQPYIEFSYQDRFYSIKIIGRLYSYRLEIRELPEPTIALDRKFEDKL